MEDKELIDKILIEKIGENADRTFMALWDVLNKIRMTKEERDVIQTEINTLEDIIDYFLMQNKNEEE